GHAAVGVFHVRNPLGDLFVGGVVQSAEPRAEGAIFCEGSFQFRRSGDAAFLGIGLQAELCDRAGAGSSTRLHPFVYEHHVIALACGEERGTKATNALSASTRRRPLIEDAAASPKA